MSLDIESILPWAGPPIGTVIGFLAKYLLDINSRNVANQKTQLETLAMNLDIYQKLIDDLEKRHETQVLEKDEKIMELAKELERFKGCLEERNSSKEN